MKNKMIAGLVLLSSILIGNIFFSSLENKDVSFAKATSDELHTIGTYFEVERVESDTKVFVSLSERTIALEAGRVIHDSFLEPGPPSVMSLNGIGGGRYYYIATPSDGKIIAKHIFKNDISSLCTVLRILNEEAKSFLTSSNIINLSIEDANNLVLQYIRYFHPEYNDDKWENIAGYIPFAHASAFSEYVLSVDSGGITLNEYFASFVSSSLDADIYESVSSQFSNLHLKLNTQIAGVPEIPFYHFLGSLDCCASGTGTSSLVFFVFDTFDIMSLSTWGGDLQQFAVNREDWIDDDFDITNDMFLNSSSSFTLGELYADIAAFLIGCSLNLESDEYLMHEIISDYFLNLTKTDMIEDFILTICSISPKSNFSNVRENLLASVYDLLKLVYHGVGNAPTQMSVTQIVSRYKFWYFYDELPSFESRVMLANAFSEYLLTEGGMF